MPDIPVVIAVPSHRFAHRIKFADGMRCDRDALAAWWRKVSARYPRPAAVEHQTVCEVLK